MRMNRVNPRVPKQSSKGSKSRSTARQQGSLADSRESVDTGLEADFGASSSRLGERRKDILIALIAAFAVLVTGFVSAFVSWQSNNNTLEFQRVSQKAQEDAATSSYLREARQKLYADIMGKFSNVERLLSTIDDYLRESSTAPDQQFESFYSGLDDFGSAILQVRLLGTPGTNDKSMALFSILVDLSRTVRSFQHAQKADPNQQLLHNSEQFRVSIRQAIPPLTDAYIEMYRNMRKDLGVPDSSDPQDSIKTSIPTFLDGKPTLPPSITTQPRPSR